MPERYTCSERILTLRRLSPFLELPNGHLPRRGEVSRTEARAIMRLIAGNVHGARLKPSEFI
jgi:hypothetical protein